MRILFDQATPVPIRSHLEGHEVRTAAQKVGHAQEWRIAFRRRSFWIRYIPDYDKNIRYQQNLSQRKSPSWFSPSSNGHEFGLTFDSCWMLSTQQLREVRWKWISQTSHGENVPNGSLA